MTSEITMDELLDLLNNKKIGYLQFVANGPYKTHFINWCKDHDVDPTDDSAELFYDQIDTSYSDVHSMDEEYGIWN